MATTTNYGWTTPDNTDLVKDGALAIRTLGSAIDTSMNTALGTKKAGMVLLNTTSFSAVSSQSLNNVFTSTYDNYRILFRATHSSGATDVTFRLRASGTDNSTANYNLQLLSAVSTTISGSNSFSQTSTIFSRISTNDVGMNSGDIFGPALPQRTCFINQFNLDNGYRAHLGEVNIASAFDGFTLTVASGTMTGVVSVYGYNK